MHDSNILSATIASKEAFDKVHKHVDPLDFSPLAAHLWPYVVEWYGRDDKATHVDLETLRERVKRETGEKHVDAHLEFLDGLPQDISVDNVVFELLEVKRINAGNELAQGIATGAKPDKLARLLKNYDKLLSAVDLGKSDRIYAGDLDEVEEDLSDAMKLSLHPPELNKRVGGGILPGDFLFIFAPPEMGKTLLCVNLVAHWLREGKRILYVGNEDKIQKIKRRIMYNLSNMDKAQADKYPEEAKKRARERGIDSRLVAVHLHPGTIPEIEELVRQHKPEVLVVDQIRNVASSSGGSAENNTSRMNQVAIDFRQLLSKYQLYGCGTAQAAPGERGRTKIWLGYDDVEGSRTGLPSQSDVQLGMSADVEMQLHNNRAISICRNKVTGDHEGLIVTIDTQRSKIL